MPHNLKCCAPDCDSNARDNPGLKFFDLMTTRASLAEWMVAIDRWDVFNDLMFGGSLTSRNICENHFPNNNDAPGTSDAALCLHNVGRSRHVKVKSSGTQTSTTPVECLNPVLPSKETRDITIRIPPSQTPQLLIISNANPEVQTRLVPESVVVAEPIESCNYQPANHVNSSLEIADIKSVVKSCITPSNIKCESIQETAEDLVYSLSEIVDGEPMVVRCITTPNNSECESTEQKNENIVNFFSEIVDDEPVVIRCITPGNRESESTEQKDGNIVNFFPRIVDDEPVVIRCITPSNSECESTEQKNENIVNSLPEIVDVKSMVMTCITPNINIACETTQQTAENIVNSLSEIIDVKSTVMSCMSPNNIKYQSTQGTAENTINSLPEISDVKPVVMDCITPITNIKSERTEQTDETLGNSLPKIVHDKSIEMSCNTRRNTVCESAQQTVVNLTNYLPDVVDVTPRVMSRNTSSTEHARTEHGDTPSSSFHRDFLSLSLSPILPEEPHVNPVDNRIFKIPTTIPNKSNPRPSRTYVRPAVATHNGTGATAFAHANRNAIYSPCRYMQVEDYLQYVEVQESAHYNINKAQNIIKNLQEFVTSEQYEIDYNREQFGDRVSVKMNNENIARTPRKRFLEFLTEEQYVTRLVKKMIENRRETENVHQNRKATFNDTYVPRQQVSSASETASIQPNVSYISGATLLTNPTKESSVHESEPNTRNSTVPRESADSRKRKTTGSNLLLNRQFGGLQGHGKRARMEGQGDDAVGTEAHFVTIEQSNLTQNSSAYTDESVDGTGSADSARPTS